MLDLIIISGASRGIGNYFIKNNYNLAKKIIAISSSEKIHELKKDNIETWQIDLSDYQTLNKKVYSSLTDHISSIGIVGCGARLGNYGGIFNSNLQDWENTINCNLLGNLSIIHACKDHIKTGIKFRAVLFAGGGAAYGYPDFFGYSLSKVAIVRAVENISIELAQANNNASIIALAPGAVETDMLNTVVQHGGFVKTKTSIDEPSNFINTFLTDKIKSVELNGKFIHVRDNLERDLSNKDLFKLRRIE